MKSWHLVAGVLVVLLASTAAVIDNTRPELQAVGVVSTPLTRSDIGILPNPQLTPGATNPAINQSNLKDTICNPNWHTSSVRDTQSTPTQKNTMYEKYGITKPVNNVGQNQMCELDHLVSIVIAGADTLDNIWPECGPANVPLNQRYFKIKDLTENRCHKEVCAGTITLAEAQKEISNNWQTACK